GRFADPFSARVHAAWQRRLANKQLFVNELFLCLIRRPAQGRGGVADRLANLFGRISVEGRATALAEERRALEAATDAMLAALGAYDPRRLGEYPHAGGTASEILDYLAMLYGGAPRSVQRPEGDIGQALPDRRISFGAET
ncbi:hypothetical protein, partial [Campylobacter coli]